MNRGVTNWEDGGDRRIFFTGSSRLYAIDAGRGVAIETFGDGGSVDLREGLDRDIGELFIASNTPGVIYDDLLILPTRVSEGARSAPGHIRAFDVRTGKARAHRAAAVLTALLDYLSGTEDDARNCSSFVAAMNSRPPAVTIGPP